jgi:S-adenosylmethionine-diacylgycerolhomoserine-N-methlytransferase
MSAELHGEGAAGHMDRMYRGQRHIYDLTRKYYLLGRDRLIADLNPPSGGSVLELGCGTGRNLIAAAKRHPGALFYGVDISNEMLSTARENVAKAGLTSRITMAQGDATAVDTASAFGVANFDRVFVSYSLSMIPPWRETASHALSLVKPGGRLAVVDFGEQARLPSWFRSGLRAWLGKFSVQPRADLKPELQRLAASAGAQLEWHSLSRDYAHYAVLLLPASR